MLLHTGTEEMAHIEMLATAVALNLEGAPLEMEEAAQDPIVMAKLGGMNVQHVISTCMAAMPVDASGVPFNARHVYATGNIAADMLAIAVAESTGRMLACQLHRMTDDPGMKDMLAYLVARDTMHQNQWMAAWEEAGGKDSMPIPSNFASDQQLQEVAYKFFSTGKDDSVPVPEGPWMQGQSFDGKGNFEHQWLAPGGEVPELGPASPKAAAQAVQTENGRQDQDRDRDRRTR